MTDRSKDFAELKETIESMQAQIITLEQRLVVTEQSIAQIEDAIEALSVDP
jgi:septal ring factor EnvC (AmiA/AmiB activator)